MVGEGKKEVEFFRWLCVVGSEVEIVNKEVWFLWKLFYVIY